MVRPDHGPPVTWGNCTYTIRRLIRANKLNAIKAGGWRIKRTDLEQLDLGQLRDLSDTPV